MANKDLRRCRVIVEVMSGQGNTKGNREYSFTAVSIYRFCVLDCSRPLNSRLSLLNGCVL